MFKKKLWLKNRKAYLGLGSKGGWSKLVCEDCGEEFKRGKDGKFKGVYMSGCGCCGGKFCKKCYDTNTKGSKKRK